MNHTNEYGPSWCRLEVASNKLSAVIWIYETIGDGTPAAPICKQISELTCPIELRVNSPGGNVFEGLAIYNALKEYQRPITAYVDGLAASAASLILMAADYVLMPENAFVMIHNAAGLTWGSADRHRTTASVLEKVTENCISAYQQKCGLSRDRIRMMMDDETWMTAQESVDLGFADEVIEQMDIAASFDLSIFKKVPNSFGQVSLSNARRSNPTRETMQQSLECRFRGTQRGDIDKAAEKEWAESPEIRAEFPSKQAFISYCAHLQNDQRSDRDADQYEWEQIINSLQGTSAESASNFAIDKWRTSALVRHEFETIERFRAYCRAVSSGMAK